MISETYPACSQRKQIYILFKLVQCRFRTLNTIYKKMRVKSNWHNQCTGIIFGIYFIITIQSLNHDKKASQQNIEEEKKHQTYIKTQVFSFGLYPEQHNTYITTDILCALKTLTRVNNRFNQSLSHNIPHIIQYIYNIQCIVHRDSENKR